MAILSTLISIAISIAISAALTIISRLLAPHSQTPTIGGQLPTIKDPGTELTIRNAAEPYDAVFGRRRVKGNIVFAHTTGNNATLHLVIVWAGHEVEALQDLYLNDELVPLDGSGNATGKYAGVVLVKDHLGAADQAADADLIAAAPDKWTNVHQGLGIAYSYVRLTFNRSLFPQGLPNIWRIVKGAKCYDPRSETTEWTDNAILCAAAFMASARYGRGIPYEGLNGIDEDALSAAANVCDEDVTRADGTTEKRYTCNAVIQSDAPFVDNLDKLLSACVGTASSIGGAWILKAAAWEAPAVTFDESDFRAGFQVQNGLGNADAFNAIKGKFANPDKLWQPDDFPAIVSSAYEIEDGGDGNGSGREFKDVALDCTTSASMAQRLARIDLRRARQPLTFTAQLKLRGLLVQPGDTVAVSFDFLGWDDKPFRVEKMKLVVGFGADAGDGSQPGIIGVDLELRETAEAIYDWDPSIDEQAVDPAPNTNLPDVFTALPPSSLVAAESLYSTRDGGGVKAKVRLSWDASPDAFVASGGGYRISYKLSSDVDYALAGTTPGLFLEILDVAPGTYDFMVEALNWAGVRSAPVGIMARQIAGLSAPPSTPQGFAVTAHDVAALARWDLPAELDVLQGGFVAFRHSPEASGATWAAAVSIGEFYPANAMAGWLPLKAGTYLAKFVDSSGIYSEVAASFAQDQASVHVYAPLSGGASVQEPDFAGAKTGCYVDEATGVLRLGGAGDFDAVPDVDALVSWDFWGGVVASGEYLFDAAMDLGTAKKCRLTNVVAALVFNVFDLIDSRTADVDDWPSWDGAVTGAEADSRLLVRSTPDDPAGMSPAWSDWQRLDAATFEARGFEFKRQLFSTDPSFTIEISEDEIVAEGV